MNVPMFHWFFSHIMTILDYFLAYLLWLYIYMSVCISHKWFVVYPKKSLHKMSRWLVLYHHLFDPRSTYWAPAPSRWLPRTSWSLHPRRSFPCRELDAEWQPWQPWPSEKSLEAIRLNKKKEPKKRIRTRIDHHYGDHYGYPSGSRSKVPNQTHPTSKSLSEVRAQVQRARSTRNSHPNSPAAPMHRP